MSDPRWDDDAGDSLFADIDFPDDTIDTARPQGTSFDDVDDIDDPYRSSTILSKSKPHRMPTYRLPEDDPKDRQITTDIEDFFDSNQDVALDPPLQNDAVTDQFDAPMTSMDGVELFDGVLDDFDSSKDVASSEQSPVPDDEASSSNQSDDDFGIGSMGLEDTIGQEAQSSKRRKWVIGSVTGVALIVGGFFGVSTLIDAVSDPSLDDVAIDTSFVANPTSVDTSEATGEFSVAGVPNWELDAEEAQLVSVYKAGMLQIHDGKAALLNTATGDEIASTELDEAIETTFETFDEDNNAAVGYQTDDEIVILSSQGAQSWEAKGDWNLVASGDLALLTDQGSDAAKVVVPGKEDLVDAEYDTDLMLSGADQDHLLQPISSTPQVELVSFDGENREVIELRAAHEQLNFVRHLSIGHGKSLALWELDGVKFASVHSLDTGEAISTVTVDSADSWTIGRGGDLATMGTFVIDMSAGHFIAEADRELDGAINTIAYVEDSDIRTLIIDEQPLRERDRLRGVTQSVTVIENSDSSISVYPHNGSPTTSTHGGGLA